MKKISLAVLLAASPAAFAHPSGVAEVAVQGFAHPFLGVDHLLAMLIVGVWAVRTARAVWLLPSVFVLSMGIGALLAPLPLPYVDPMIGLSALVFGLPAVLAERLPLPVGGALVALFALFHGHAHFTEMPAGSPIGFAAGMLGATALLHLAGIAIGRVVLRPRASQAA